MPEAQGVVVYVSFGAGRHVSEIVASLISATAFPSVQEGRVKLAVVTDNATPFERLPVRAIVIPPEQALAWRGGPTGNVYNVKIRAMQHVLQTLNLPAVMTDGDTYFRRDPIALFRRIGPGRTLMHLRESSLGQIQFKAQLDLRDAIQGHTYTTRRGDKIPLGNGISIWNSGVVGCHPANVDLVDEAFDFSAYLFGLCHHAIAEQIAFGLLFEKYTKLRPAWDTVFHYWNPPIRREFSANLPELLKSLERLPLAEQAARLRAKFPQHSAKFRIKRWFRDEVLVRLGLRERVFPTS